MQTLTDIIIRPITAVILRLVLDFTAARTIRLTFRITTIIRTTDITGHIMDTTVRTTGTTAGLITTEDTATTADIRATIDPIPTGPTDDILASRSHIFRGITVPGLSGATRTTRPATQAKACEFLCRLKPALAGERQLQLASEIVGFSPRVCLEG